jgi:hypothetical protein
VALGESLKTKINADLWKLQTFTGSADGWEMAIDLFKAKYPTGKGRKWMAKFEDEYLVGPWKSNWYLGFHFSAHSNQSIEGIFGVDKKQCLDKRRHSLVAFFTKVDTTVILFICTPLAHTPTIGVRILREQI